MNQEVLNFYNKNKNLVYTPPALPQNLSVMDKARWIVNNPNFAWLELDIPIPELYHECLTAEQYYVPHREGESSGWDSCCIHGIRTDATQNWPEYVAEEDENTYRWTELSEEVPGATHFWKTFPSEKYKRVLFMKVAAGGYISPHSDAPGGGYIPGEPVDYDPLELGCPVNIALIHPRNCDMVLEGFGVVPFKPNRAFLINIRHRHAVVNFSSKDRIHMIGFGVYGDRKEQFAELIVRSYERS
jgi:hypothetical protein